jgi:hypothetical protein
LSLFNNTSKKARALQREKKNPFISLARSVGQTMRRRFAGYEIETSHRQFYFLPVLRTWASGHRQVGFLRWAKTGGK